jgi:hypothetical protein
MQRRRLALLVIVKQAFAILGCTTGGDMYKTPSAVEYKGLYNVEPSNDIEQNQEQYLVITAGLGRPTFDEISSLTDCICRVMYSSGVKPGSLYYDLGFLDRTAKISFRDPADLSTERLKSLQGILNSEFEEWRIAVVGISAHSTIIVYPSKIVFPFDDDEPSQLNRIRDELVSEHDESEGSFQRQLQYVRQLLPSFSSKLESFKGPPLVLAVFDNYRGDKRSLCVWVIDPGDGIRIKNWIPDEDMGDGFEGTAGAVAEFDVTDEGDLVDAYSAEDRYRGCSYALVYNKDKNRGKIYMVSPFNRERVELSISEYHVLTSARNDK